MLCFCDVPHGTLSKPPDPQDGGSLCADRATLFGRLSVAVIPPVRYGIGKRRSVDVGYGAQSKVKLSKRERGGACTAIWI